MSDTAADFLVEIGTEELPPTALRSLMDAFVSGMEEQLGGQRLAFASAEGFASPRRLAVLVRGLVRRQEDREVELKGPPTRIAFDDDGKPTPAGAAFAKKCGVPMEQLDRITTDKGEWLVHRRQETGESAAELLPAAIEAALKALPVPRPMRWGSSDAEFVRPVHWVVMLHGQDLVEGEILGVSSGRETRGHRFHAPSPLSIDAADRYAAVLEDGAFVVPDFDGRKRIIEKAVAEAAAECGGTPVGGDALYDEVSALVEWPVGVTGRFDEAFLSLPREVIVATLTSHQRYFPVEDDSGELLPAFVTIANLVSQDPDKVREGNERVIRPRLADAAFFWDSDRRAPLSERRESLAGVIYQKGLGSLADKSARVARLCALIAEGVGADAEKAQRSGELAKCDLVTGVVGEFPELQGTMGRYYALADGEDSSVADAIGQQYMPRFAGDAIPEGIVGQILAIADKLETLAGIFALGKKPSGNRDPFGLRRGALGLARIIVEAELDLDLRALVAAAVADQPVDAPAGSEQEVYDFVVDRLRALWVDEDIGVEMFDAVRARAPESLLDFRQRLEAVAAFSELEPAASLAAANKRIGNILRQADYGSGDRKPDAALFTESAETALHGALNDARKAVVPLVKKRAYTEALSRLAELREPVDVFFDDVMVMTEDDKVRENRLALLAGVREQFLEIADISRLSIK